MVSNVSKAYSVLMKKIIIKWVIFDTKDVDRIRFWNDATIIVRDLVIEASTQRS